MDFLTAGDDSSMWQCRQFIGQGLIAASVALLLLSGCGGGGRSGPSGTVSGTIKHKGETLTDKVTVTFLSAEGVAATGQTDSTGYYSLTYEKSPQIPVGSYKVAVTPFVAAFTAPQDPAMFFDPKTGATRPPEAPKTRLPSKYANPNTSKIVRDIAAGPNTIDINLPD